VDSLTKFIEQLRKLGVLSFSGTVEGLGPVSVQLLPELPETTQPAEQNTLPGKEEKPARGQDGLDAEMQQALYGRVLDAKG
jgi:hypothetical protein